jgi:FkbM family methyltransferase
LLQCIKPGDTVIDIGAYKGAYTYWMSKAVGKLGRVYAFEPQKSAYDSLYRIINSKKIKNIVLEQTALSSKNGEMCLAIPGTKEEYSPGATLEVKDNENYKAMYNVRVKTLDSYFQELNVNRLSFIKCDAEGHELEIFRGGTGILKEYKPTLLLECEKRHLNRNTVHDVFAFLEQQGYKGSFCYKNKLCPLTEFQIERHQSGDKELYVNNFLFVAIR